MRKIVLAGAVRTAIGKFGGALCGVAAPIRWNSKKLPLSVPA